MNGSSSSFSRICALAGALLVWFALVLQYFLITHDKGSLWFSETIRFISYFTILSNLLVALSFTALWKDPKTFFARSPVSTAIAVYIVLVGIGYNLLLRQEWNPQGWQRVADELLHSVIPAFYVFYWFIFVPKINIPWKSIGAWSIYPTLYIAYILMRGAWTGFYPYPFVFVTMLGYRQVLINIGGLLIAFIILSVLFIGISRKSYHAGQL
jgi:fumarate reductase subunit C